MPRSSDLDLGELIAFKVRGQAFCVEIVGVREIRGWSAATPLPKAPDYVCGIVNLRGTVLPIVDLGARLGLGLTDPSDRHAIVVVEVTGRAVGLLVDAVSDIMSATDAVLQPTPELGGGHTQALLKGILSVEGEMLGVINLEEVLPRPLAEAA